MILSEFVRPEIILSTSPKALGLLRRQCSVVQLRLVSHHFRALIDSLLAKYLTKDIWLAGPVPFDDRGRLEAVCSVWMFSLRMILSPLLQSSSLFKMKVHLLPELRSMHAEVNWDMNCRSLNPEDAPEQPMKDDYTAAKAMTGHYTAAVILSQMLKNIFQANIDAVKRGKVHVTFYEVDGTSLNVPHFMSEQSQPQPAILPFWEFDAVDSIVRHWQWIRGAPHGPYRKLRSSMTLPVFAMATEMALPPGALFEHCSRTIQNAWHRGQPWVPAPRLAVARMMVKLPWVPWTVYCPRTSLYAIWLTTLSPRRVDTGCFALRGVEVLRVGDDRRYAVDMERPTSLLILP